MIGSTLAWRRRYLPLEAWLFLIGWFLVSPVLAAENGSRPGEKLPVTAQPGDTVISLTWEPPEGLDVETYRIYRGAMERPLAEVANTHFEDIALSNGTSYTYTIVAILSDGTMWKGYETISTVAGMEGEQITTTTEGTVATEDCASVASINDEEGLAGTLEFPTEMNCYIFEGEAGERITAFVDNRTTGSGWQNRLLGIRLLGPDGTELARHYPSGCCRHNVTFKELALPESGTYTLVVEGQGATTGPYVLDFKIGKFHLTPEIYSNDFEGTAGSEWSNAATDRTPSGRRFLGQFGNATVNLTLTDLPPHTQVTISFDLFIIRSWDGNSTEYGPDIWELSVNGGPTLLRTTFSQWKEVRQAYPDEYPGGDHPGLSGAAEMDTLGYTFTDAGRTFQTDSVYQLSFTFPHSADSLVLNFSGSGLQDLTDESWGLDDVKVSVTPAKAL